MEYQLQSGEYAIQGGHYVAQLGAGGRRIASFEGSEFDDCWHGRKDTINGDLSTSSVQAVDGEQSLFHAAGDGYDATLSNPGDGLPLYIGVPSTQRFYVWCSDWSDMSASWRFCRRNSGNDGLRLRLWGSVGSAYFYEYVGGSEQSIARDDTITFPTSQWLEVTITVNGPDGTPYAGLSALEPQIEIYTVNSDFSRNTEVTTFTGNDGQGDPTAISSSNALAEGEGGYRWTFNADAGDMFADYHHEVPSS